jgi:hypothetical protein
MARLAFRTLGIVAACALVAVGCDDEVTTSPDAGAKDGSADTAAADSGASDVPATPSEAGSGDATAAPDAAPLTAMQERGRYLVDNVIGCPECHTPHDPMTGAPMMKQYLSGWECLIKLPNGDCLSSRNLTNDVTGLKNRTDDEIKQMFLNGIRPAATGNEALNPFMPYYVFHNMDPGDADAIVAYLRTVTPVSHMVPKRGMEFDLPMHANYLDPATIPQPRADYPEKASASRGRYLAAQTGLCIECHTKHNMMSPDVLTPANFFAGGEEFPLGFPMLPRSLNITSDPTTGIGNWAVADVIKVLKEGKDKDGKGICPPMPVGPMGAYAGITYQDTLDIANYIKSLPPVVNQVADMCSYPFGPPPATDGGAAPDAGMSTDAVMSTDAAASTDGATSTDTATSSD